MSSSFIHKEIVAFIEVMEAIIQNRAALSHYKNHFRISVKNTDFVFIMRLNTTHQSREYWECILRADTNISQKELFAREWFVDEPGADSYNTLVSEFLRKNVFAVDQMPEEDLMDDDQLIQLIKDKLFINLEKHIVLWNRWAERDSTST